MGILPHFIALPVSIALLTATLAGPGLTDNTAASKPVSSTPVSVAGSYPDAPTAENIATADVYETSDEYTGSQATPNNTVDTPVELPVTALSDAFSRDTSYSVLPSQNVTIDGMLNDSVGENRTVNLEEEDSSGVWTVIQSQEANFSEGDTLSDFVTFNLSGLSTGTHFFRAAVPATDKAQAATGGVKTVTVAPKTLSISVNSVVSNLSSLDPSYGFSASVTIPAYGSSNRVFLEKLNRTTGSWVVVSASMVTSSTGFANISLYDVRDNAETVSATYRVRTVSFSADYVGVTTPEYTVSYKKTTTVLSKSSLTVGGTQTIPATKSLQVTGTLNSVDTSRVVYLQAYNATSKTWVNVSNAGTNKGAYNLTVAANEAASTIYRVYVPASGIYTETVTGSSIVKRTMVSTQTINNYGGSAKTVPWVDNRLSWYVYDYVGTTAQVQRLYGKTWKTVSTSKTDSKGAIYYSVPKGTTSTSNQTMQFRLYIPKHTVGVNATYTAARKVVWENPNKYTGMAKTVYNYMKSQCPTVMVSLSSNLGKNVWGLAHLGQSYISVYNKVPAKYLQTVSLHECGHHRQWKFYGASTNDWSTFQSRMNAIYGQKGTLGMEQNADCIANAWHKNSYYGYKGNCNGTRGVAGKTLAANKRY